MTNTLEHKSHVHHNRQPKNKFYFGCILLNLAIFYNKIKMLRIYLINSSKSILFKIIRTLWLSIFLYLIRSIDSNLLNIVVGWVIVQLCWQFATLILLFYWTFLNEILDLCCTTTATSGYMHENGYILRYSITDMLEYLSIFDEIIIILPSQTYLQIKW